MNEDDGPPYFGSGPPGWPGFDEDDEDDEDDFELPLPIRIQLNASVVAQLSHNLWTTWAELAIGHERDARQAREEGLKTRSEGSHQLEFRSALQAITQVAFALDGWFGATHPVLHDGKDRPKRGINDDDLINSVRKAVKKEHGGWSTLEGDIRWLFGRDGSRATAVHHQPKWTPGTRHPVVDGDVPAEYTAYSAEQATRALGTLRAVLDGCLNAPKEVIASWLESNRGVIERILSGIDEPLSGAQ
jgi:hypothetical protein